MHEIAKYVATDLYVRAARHPASRPILFDAARKAWKAILDGSKDLALSLRLKYYRAAIAAARTADDCDEARRLYRAAAGAAVHQATSQRGDAADASLAKATSEAWVSFEKERGTLATLDAAEARQRNWRRDLDGHFKVHGGARKTLKQPEVATKAKAPPSAATLATRKRAADAAAAASAKKRSRGADGEPVAAQAPETAEAVPEAPAAVAEAPAAAPLDAPPAAADGEARAPGAKKKKQKSAASNEASDELARTVR
ncbi:hypothetical protein M885DRAFT_58937 [Pelagophyceae sp. CCMP2097]|nr:hypothetical protein M885DRAFT_58937 [Pelagophyceae sp. CCMP2097]